MQKSAQQFDPRSWDQRIGDSVGSFADNIGKTFDEFDYASVDSEAATLCDELRAARLNPEQATIILRWHTDQIEVLIERARASIIATIAAGIIASENVPLDARSLVLASGIGPSVALVNQSRVAEELNVSRSAVSKCANKWADILGYRVTKFMRTEKARKACSIAQTKAHWRNRL